MWLTPDGRRVLTGDPYGVDADAVLHLLRECRALGLPDPEPAPGVWFPGSTTLITVTGVHAPRRRPKNAAARDPA
jgi:hypothetical protein